MACDLLMDEAGLDFRLTKDIDMVLIVEALTDDFAKVFWNFIDAGGYHARKRSSGTFEFYRFVEPKNPEYPMMIELFARPQSGVHLHASSHLIPLHFDDEISSLSAILLNESYYSFLCSGRITTQNVSVLDAKHIIPFKMKAWLDLTEKKEQGSHVNERDIRKHRQDVFRLYPLVDPKETVNVPAEVYNDIQAFIEAMKKMDYDLKPIGLTRGKDEILDLYSQIYQLEEQAKAK